VRPKKIQKYRSLKMVAKTKKKTSAASKKEMGTVVTADVDVERGAIEGTAAEKKAKEKADFKLKGNGNFFSLC
jgi:hypothetical protein